MKALETIIKLKKQEIDQLLVQIKRKEVARDNLIKAMQKLLEQAKEEKTKYYATEYAQMLEKYLMRVKEQEKTYKDRIEKIDENIRKLRDDLIEYYAELKKYEQVMTSRKQAEAEAKQRAEDKERDEISTLRYKNPNN